MGGKHKKMIWVMSGKLRIIIAIILMGSSHQNHEGDKIFLIKTFFFIFVFGEFVLYFFNNFPTFWHLFQPTHIHWVMTLGKALG